MKIESLEVQDGAILVKLINIYDVDQRIELQLTTDFEVVSLQNNSLYSGKDLLDEINMIKAHVQEITSAYE